MGRDGLTFMGDDSGIDFGKKAAGLEAQLLALSQFGLSEAQQETNLQNLRISHLEELLALKKKTLAAAHAYEASEEQKLAADVAKMESEYTLRIYKERLEKEKKLKKAQGIELSKEEKDAMLKACEEEAAAKKKLFEAELKDKAEAEKKAEAKRRKTGGKTQSIEKFNAIFEKGATPAERVAALKNMAKGPDGQFSGKALVGNLTAGLANLAKQLENKMDEVGKHKAPIDTRLYGSNSNETSFGSYYDKISQKFTGIAGASPFILQADLISNLETLVQKGISSNIQQRAFLATIKDKVAATFEVADGTLLKLVRIQQADTTAARMGMESALNAFLNNMYETTEYLTDLASTVRANLYEAQSLMDADAATEFEYQVQKWMGSMYSVGMSDSAVTALSTALGQLASGDINALTSGGAGNLFVMAANAAGMSISEILQDGLSADKTNELLNAAVEYLGTIAQQSDSKVIQQQLAGIFGVKASDLKAIMNLKTVDGSASDSTMNSIFNDNLTYSGMIDELTARANTMWQRVSMGEMMSNVWQNMQYSMAAGMASNPITYLLYKVGGLLEETTGGIDLPFLNVYGFGVDLNTTVAQLMQVGAMSGGILSALGSMITNLGAGGGFSGSGMLKAVGVGSGLNTVARGVGDTTATRSVTGATFSESGVLGNGSGEDVQGSMEAQAADTSNSMQTQGAEEFDKDATTEDVVNAINEGSDRTADGLEKLSESVYALTNALTASTGGVGGGFSGNVGLNSNFGKV